jgi:hypothetical protein
MKYGQWLARSTVFAAFFAITGFILALRGLLTSQYVAAITAVHAFVLGRAIADDYHQRQTDAPEDTPTEDPKS